MKFIILTLFPEMIKQGLSHSVIGRAVRDGVICVEAVDIRDFTENKHRQADDYPYGGGCGMVMKPEPVHRAYLHAAGLCEKHRVLLMSPRGKTFDQEMAKDLSQAQSEAVIIICGHYEGIDERIIEEIVTDEISIGDYILTGGEPAAIVLIDSVSRLVPGVLGKAASSQDESFSDGLLEYPHYTRPPVFRGRAVPDVLLSGHHGQISAWRKAQSQTRTQKKRPDLL